MMYSRFMGVFDQGLLRFLSALNGITAIEPHFARGHAGFYFRELGMATTSADVSQTVKAVSPANGLELKLEGMTFSSNGMVFSTEELRRISAEISRDFAPVLIKQTNAADSQIRFSPSELLEVSSWINRSFSPKPNQSKGLFLLPIDPAHVYIYWDMPSLPSEIIHKDKLDKHLSLKVYPATSGELLGDEKAPPCFEAAINNQMPYRQMASLPANEGQTVYAAVIGEQRPDHCFVEVAHSNTIHFSWPGTLGRQTHLDDPILKGLPACVPGLSSEQPINASGQR